MALSAMAGISAIWARFGFGGNHTNTGLQNRDLCAGRIIFRQLGDLLKQRGAGVDPSSIIKQLKTEGDPVSLIAWKVEKSIRYAVAQRV